MERVPLTLTTENWHWHLCDWTKSRFTDYFAMLTIWAGACNNSLSICKFSKRIFHFSSSTNNRSSTISNYLEKSIGKQNLERLPAKLKHPIVQGSDTKLYIASDAEASRIADAIKSKRKQNVPLLEVLPGPGILTNYLTKLNAEPLLLYENDPAFVPNLMVGPLIIRLYPIYFE